MIMSYVVGIAKDPHSKVKELLHNFALLPVINGVSDGLPCDQLIIT